MEFIAQVFKDLAQLCSIVLSWHFETLKWF